MSRRKVLLHNAIVEFSPDTPRSLYLTNIGDAPVHLTKGYVVGTATAYNEPLHVVADEGGPGAVLTVGMDTPSKTDEEAETSRRAEEGIDEGQPPLRLGVRLIRPHPPDKTYPKPEVHWEGFPDALRGDVDDLLEEYRTLWAGQLGKVDVTPHRIEVTSGARSRRAQPYRAIHASQEVIAKEVQRQRDLGVIEPSSAECSGSCPQSQRGITPSETQHRMRIATPESQRERRDHWARSAQKRRKQRKRNNDLFEHAR